MNAQRLTRFLTASVLAAALAGTTGGAEPSAAFENFTDEAWSSLGRGGKWDVEGKHELHQNDPDEPWRNNGFYRMLEQSGAMVYEFEVKVATEKGGAGLFIMGNEPQGVEHGNSYLAYYSEGPGSPDGGGLFRIGRFVDNKPDPKWFPTFSVSGTRGQWVKIRLQYSASTGEFVASCNGTEIGRATDESPVKQGNHVAVHSFSTAAQFRNVRVQRTGE